MVMHEKRKEPPAPTPLPEKEKRLLRIHHHKTVNDQSLLIRKAHKLTIWIVLCVHAEVVVWHKILSESRSVAGHLVGTKKLS